MAIPLASPAKADTPIRRVAMLFSGGPAPSANAVIASAATAFSKAGIEAIGMKNGYTHLVNYKPGDKLEEGVAYVKLDHKDLEGVRTTQGIMIGTARANPGKAIKEPKDLKDPKQNTPLKTVYDALRSMEVDALISIGGDDTLTTAAKFKLFQDTLPEDLPRIKVVHLPKTIDNDYQGIDFTFGYFSAVDLLAKQLRNLLADSMATGAGFVCQLMGRKAAWLAYGAAIAGEASLVIGLEDIAQEWKSEEETVDPSTGKKVLDADGKPRMREIFLVDGIVNHIVDVLIAREADGMPHAVIVMSEGIAEYLPLEEIHKCLSEDEYKTLKPDSFGHFPVSQLKFSSRIARLAAEEFERRTGKPKKLNGLQFGYEVRCTAPTAFDVILGSQLGVGAYRALAEQGENAVMISVDGTLDLVFAKFEDLINYDTLRAHQRPVELGSDFHQLPRYLEARVEK